MTLPFEIEAQMDGIRREIELSGAELVEISCRRAGGRAVLTVLVDKPGGVTLDDCVDINGRLGRFFDGLSAEAPDGDGFLRSPYYLEVNSPGLDRPLKTEKDFLRVVGHRVRVTVQEAPGRFETHLGRLRSVSGGNLELETADGSVKAVPIAGVTRAAREIVMKK